MVITGVCLKPGGVFFFIETLSVLPKVEEIYNFAKLINTSLIGISETKLDGSILNNEIKVHNIYDLTLPSAIPLFCHRIMKYHYQLINLIYS